MTARRATKQSPDPIYINDLGVCTPVSALSKKPANGRWQVFSYETFEKCIKKGVMISVPSFLTAPEVRLPLGITGWHHVYIGCWNPHYAYDGGMTLKVKLNSDQCFTRISDPEPALDAGGTYLREVFFKTADLTAESICFGQIHGPLAKKACVAYLKLMPLTNQEVAALKKERSGTDTRIIAATNDGISYFHANEYNTKEHILELVEPYRHSDVRRVIWAVNYGDTTNYPSRGGAWIAGANTVPIKNAANSHIAGVKAGQTALRALKAKGIIPQDAAARHAHAMGLKFDVMFRLGILGHIPPQTFHTGRFIKSHPECRQVTRAGVPVEKASYAFPAVRSFMLALIKEAAEKFDIDGAVLGFNRGPEFMLYERQVLDDYRRACLKNRPLLAQAPKTRRLLFLPQAERAPHIDGCLDDECWKRVCHLGNLTGSGGQPPRNATSVIASFDRHNLYLAIRCAVKDASKLKKDCPLGEKSGKAWTDDCIDMKISADGGRTACQFIVSASGASWMRNIGDNKSGSDWFASVRIDSEEYTVEIAIPLQTIGINSFKPGMSILFNIGRADRTEGEQLSILTEPYLGLYQAPLAVLGTEAEFRALPGAAKMARIDYVDGRNVPFTNPVMQSVRCGYLTQFVRDARRLLDKVGTKKGRRIELGVWVYGDAVANLRHGFDVETWVKERLIDSVIGFMSADPADDQHLIQFAKAHGCRYLAAFIPWFDYSAQTAVNKAAAAYSAGVDGLAVWDIDQAQDIAAWWPMGRMLGHADKIREWAKTSVPTLKNIRLKRVAGYDVAEGLYAAVYSGG